MSPPRSVPVSPPRVPPCPADSGSVPSHTFRSRVAAMMTGASSPSGCKLSSRPPLAIETPEMYLIEFVNHVRQAQSYEGLAQLPSPGADGSTPLELAMGCRLEHGAMRL